MILFSEIIEFIRRLYNEPTGIIPLHAPTFKGNEKRYLNECIDTTFVSSVGKFVDLFEEKVAEYTCAKRAVVCVNGTNALHMALMMVGVERGTEVITQPLTFIATANAISYCGAEPVFLDVGIDTMGLSPQSLLHFLETNTEQRNDGCYNNKTKNKITACVPMHTFGHPARIDEIIEICNQYNIPVVEDAAESLGSFYKGKHTGTFGKIGVLSFNGNKIITTGGGGMLLFKDETLAIKAKSLTTQSKVTHKWELVHDEIGYNYRMSNLNAALGCAQLENLDTYISKKRKIANSYKKFFEPRNILFFSEPENSISNYWLNAIFLKDKMERDAFLEYTNDQGIRTRPAWKLMNKLSMFQHCVTGDLTNANQIEDTLVNLPSSVPNEK